MSLIVDGREIEIDRDGHLRDLEDWSEAVAESIARTEGIDLTTDHWEILQLLRRFYREYQLAPPMRPLVRYVSKGLGPDKGHSIYLLRLFPPSPARIASKIAGLPRPDHCL